MDDLIENQVELLFIIAIRRSDICLEKTKNSPQLGQKTATTGQLSAQGIAETLGKRTFLLLPFTLHLLARNAYKQRGFEG